MNYISAIFERANLQQIREFLLYGTECLAPEEGSYKQRLEEAGDVMLEYFRQKFPDPEELEQAVGEIYRFADVYQNVYMEIGLQCGAVLAAKLGAAKEL